MSDSRRADVLVMNAGTTPPHTPVLIVGGGPVGLLAAILLDAQGIDSAIVERRAEVQPAPAAHVVNARTFEICRAAGIDPAAVDAACQPAADGAWVRWMTSLTGDELGCVPFERQDRIDDLDAITPTPLRNLSQHRFEPLLRDHLARLDRTELRVGTEWVGGRQSATGVVSTLVDTTTGAVSELESSYLIAADGAGSPVRRWLGIAMEGPTRLNAIITIHAEADLRHLVGEHPATLYWITDPAHEGVFVAHDIDRTWVFMHNWDPDTEQLEDYTVERCTEIFRGALGDGGAGTPFEIRTISPWMMTCQVADRYRDGRGFLVGDAAHRFPPTGGLGLNTGAVDVQNLAWKIAAVEHGWAEASLLDTYASERKPIATANAEQSLVNAFRLLEVRAALDVSDGSNEAASTDEVRVRVAAAIDGQAEHFDLLGLQLGFAYISEGSAVVDDGTPLPVADDPVRDYLPTTHPGARLPHAWIVRDDHVVSTLDLVAPDRFVLLTASPAWATAGEKVATDAVPVDVVLVGRDITDPAGNWARAAAPPKGGALLVRPDQHIAWRATGPTGDPAGDLHDVLTSLTAIR